MLDRPITGIETWKCEDLAGFAVVLLYAKPAESVSGICISRRIRMADCIPDENTESVRAFVCDVWTLGVSIPYLPHAKRALYHMS